MLIKVGLGREVGWGGGEGGENWESNDNQMSSTGADPGFSFRGGGGGRKRGYVPARTLRAWNRTHFWQGGRHMAKGSILKNLVPRKTGLKIRYLP